jgi:hypothetical protein
MALRTRAMVVPILTRLLVLHLQAMVEWEVRGTLVEMETAVMETAAVTLTTQSKAIQDPAPKGVKRNRKGVLEKKTEE